MWWPTAVERIDCPKKGSRFDPDMWICPVQASIELKSAPSPPPAIDPQALAAAQTQSNIQTAEKQAQINNSNTFSPLGQTLWTQDPNTGQWQLNQNLSPAMQALLGGAQGIASGAQGIAPGYLSQAQSAQAPLNTNFGDLTKQAQNAAYGTATQYLDPQFAQQRSDLTQQLADQGINPNNAAYSRATGDLGRQQQLGYNAAQNAAVTAGDAEQQALFTEALNNQGQQFQQGLGGLGAILGYPSTLNWASGLPTYGGQNTTVSPSNVVGAAQVASQNAQNRFSDSNLLNNQLFNGLGSLGSSLFGGGGSSGGIGGLLGGLFGAGTAAATAGTAEIPAALGFLAAL